MHSSHLFQRIVVVCNSRIPSIKRLSIITAPSTAKLLRRRMIRPLGCWRWWCIGWCSRWWRCIWWYGWWRCIGWYGRWWRCIGWNSRMIHIFLIVWILGMPIIVIPSRRARSVGRTLPLPPTILPCKLSPHQLQISSPIRFTAAAVVVLSTFACLQKSWSNKSWKPGPFKVTRIYEKLTGSKLRNNTDTLWIYCRADAELSIINICPPVQLAPGKIQYFFATNEDQKGGLQIWTLPPQVHQPTLRWENHVNILVKITLWNTSLTNIQDTSFTVTLSQNSKYWQFPFISNCPPTMNLRISDSTK